MDELLKIKEEALAKETVGDDVAADHAFDVDPGMLQHCRQYVCRTVFAGRAGGGIARVSDSDADHRGVGRHGGRR